MKNAIISGKRNQSYDAELWANSDALEVAIKETRNANANAVPVFTDSSAAMTKMGKKVAKPEGLAVRDLVYERAKELTKNGHSVTLRWIPGHSKIEGNEKADSAAKIAEDGGGKETDCWSSLTHMKTKLKRTRLAELSAWHHARKGSQQTRILCPKKKMWYRLNVGKGAKEVCSAVLPT